MRDVICNEAVPFRPYCGGVVTRTPNVSEYMLVLVLCLVTIISRVASLYIERKRDDYWYSHVACLAGSPSNTMWPGPRRTSMHSFVLIYRTLWPQYTNVIDRQDRQTGQRSVSIGRTVFTVQSYSPADANVPSREGISALPGEYN